MSGRERDPGTRLSLEGDIYPPGDAHPQQRRSCAAPGRQGHRSWAAAARTRHVSSVYLSHAHYLQPRDQVILDLLGEHQTLSTPQISAILFRSDKRASNRLYQLRSRGWVESFGRVTAQGRLPTHWALGALGERWVAAGQERVPLGPAALRRRLEALGRAGNILHDDGQRQVFVDLLRVARSSWDRPPAQQEQPVAPKRLARWWSPAHTASVFAQRIHPDGHGVWEEQERPGGPRVQVGFFLEYDRGTEALGILAAKLDAYGHLLRQGERPTVLFWLESELRERHLHQRFAGLRIPAGLTVATTCSSIASGETFGPAGTVWRVLTPSEKGTPPVERVRLRDLPELTDSTNQTLGPPTETDDPLRSLL